jgi:hypothetical protein
MRIAYRRLPEGWDTYWRLRVNGLPMRIAGLKMVEDGFTEFSDYTLFTLRQAEIYTNATIVCECQGCFLGYTEKEHIGKPIVILEAKYYNETSWDGNPTRRSYWQ